MFEIMNKSDFQKGTMLVIKMPQDDLDKKALKTIAADTPNFILPFTYRFVDNEVELTYFVNNCTKLKYLAGNKSDEEYFKLWVSILQPLMDCPGWFMTPYSFILDSDYLFFDKSKDVIKYIYVPSIKNRYDYEDLKQMVTLVAKENRVKDAELENKVIWAIQDFNPSEFLAMLKEVHGVVEKKEIVEKEKVVEKVNKPIATDKNMLEKVLEKPKKNNVKKDVPKKEIISVSAPVVENNNNLGELAFDFSNNDSKNNKGLFGKKKEKKPLVEKEKKSFKFWGKNNSKNKEIIQGSAENFISDKNLISNDQQRPIHEKISQNNYSIQYEDLDDEVTQLDEEMLEVNTRLRYIGVEYFPKIISINIDEEETFSIGRYDVSIGSKQSDFEFDKKTKSVSRRHAVIEHKEDGYYIVDLSSAAGTFVNHQKIPSNFSMKLENGFKVSFGHSGADYIWEE